MLDGCFLCEFVGGELFVKALVLFVGFFFVVFVGRVLLFYVLVFLLDCCVLCRCCLYVYWGLFFIWLKVFVFFLCIGFRVLFGLCVLAAVVYFVCRLRLFVVYFCGFFIGLFCLYFFFVIVCCTRLSASVDSVLAICWSSCCVWGILCVRELWGARWTCCSGRAGGSVVPGWLLTRGSPSFCSHLGYSVEWS